MSKILLLSECAERMRKIIKLSGQEPCEEMVMGLSVVIMNGDIIIMHSDTRRVEIIQPEE